MSLVSLRLVSGAGIVVILLFGYLFSTARRQIIWRHVVWGLGLQFIFGLMILRWSEGREFFNCLGGKVDTFLGYTDAGSSFVFGYLVNQRPFLPNNLVNGSLAQQVAIDINRGMAVPAVVVFKALSVVYFFRELWFNSKYQCHILTFGRSFFSSGFLLQMKYGANSNPEPAKD